MNVVRCWAKVRSLLCFPSDRFKANQINKPIDTWAKPLSILHSCYFMLLYCGIFSKYTCFTCDTNKCPELSYLLRRCGSFSNCRLHQLMFYEGPYWQEVDLYTGCWERRDARHRRMVEVPRPVSARELKRYPHNRLVFTYQHGKKILCIVIISYAHN